MSSQKWVAGIDGAQKGWIVAYLPLRKTEGCFLVRYENFKDVKRETTAMGCLAVAIDMPIGLIETPEQSIDSELRKRLGERRSSLFPTPSSAVLKANSYEEANQLNRDAIGKGISIQTWNLLPQIRQVRETLKPEEMDRFFECHPESTFCELAGRPLQSKKTSEGIQERTNLLKEIIPDIKKLIEERPPKCKADDALDAIAAAWSAERYANNKATILGGDEYDSEGYPVRVII
tara:strand:- start:615 stop:1313 length:699 start_codon:yes stop_codon:yes gene_type:complete